MNKLEDLRQKIDDCDQQLTTVLEKRLAVVLEILEYKRKHEMPIYQPDREEIVLDRIVGRLEHSKFSAEIEELYRKIIEISRKLQYEKILSGNLVLIGFMGTGKSVIGKFLSQKLGVEWIDIDTAIEKEMNMSIPLIFEQYGEEYFRQIERKIVEKVSQDKGKIISCGGGVVLNPQNVQLLKCKGRIILLESAPEIIYNRLKNDDTRPLLKGNITLEYIEKMLNQRKAIYHQAADYCMDTRNKTVEEIAMEIIELLFKSKK